MPLYSKYYKNIQIFFLCQTQSRCSNNLRSTLMALEGKPRKSLAEELAPDYLLRDGGARSKVKGDKILHRVQGRMKEKQRE